MQNGGRVRCEVFKNDDFDFGVRGEGAGEGASREDDDGGYLGGGEALGEDFGADEARCAGEDELHLRSGSNRGVGRDKQVKDKSSTLVIRRLKERCMAMEMLI